MPEQEPNLDVGLDIRDPRTAVLSVGGELDMETATRLEERMTEQLDLGRRHLVLDLAALDFMDSSGLNVLIRVLHRARETGGDLHLAAPTPAVRRILEITGVTTALPPYEGVAEALVAAGAGR
ncbi:STAS domain-containing protein [Streptomyces hydrogenans]|uniref:STAS domain-containing protein n=1 Tax=Streptomyces hydrogenans TaxID=1873719 RepID=UPI0035E28898